MVLHRVGEGKEFLFERLLEGSAERYREVLLLSLTLLG